MALAGLAAALGAAPLAPAQQVTAFRALFQAGKQAPGASLVSISGSNGAPQPAAWVFVYADPAARGGAREVVVRAGAVESVRTPLKGYAGISERPVVSLDRLAVDSDRAFQLANAAAIRARVGFDALNYQLEARADGEPVWLLDLLPAGGGSPVGRVRVSASSGEVDAGGLFSTGEESNPLGRAGEDVRFLLEGFEREVRGFFERLGRSLRDVIGEGRSR